MFQACFKTTSYKIRQLAIDKLEDSLTRCLARALSDKQQRFDSPVQHFPTVLYQHEPGVKQFEDRSVFKHHGEADAKTHSSH